MRKIILTGFGPFGELQSNPTEKLIHSLEETLENELYQFFVLPVSYSYCSGWSEKHISDEVCLVIHFGVSAKSEVIQLERSGRNIAGSTKDVDGNCHGSKILKDGPEKIQSSLDLKRLCKQMNGADFQCEVSDNAGDYLCNFILYKSLCVAAEKTLFVHVPPESKMPISELKEFTLEMIRNLLAQVETNTIQ